MMLLLCSLCPLEPACKRGPIPQRREGEPAEARRFMHGGIPDSCCLLELRAARAPRPVAAAAASGREMTAAR